MFKQRKFLRTLSDHEHKYSRGIVGIVAGSDAYPGAATLAVGGARRGGAGYIKYLDQSKKASKLVLQNFPDVVLVEEFNEKKVDAVLLGPGMPKLVTFPESIPVVLDSSAIAAVDTKRNPITVLTPHEGELKYLGYELKDRKTTAQRIADDLGAIVVLKGSHTLVAAPGSSLMEDSIGGAELATAGSGDILAGLIASALASWKPESIADAQKIVFTAVQTHSRAGKIARKRNNPVVATDILEALRTVNL